MPGSSQVLLHTADVLVHEVDSRIVFRRRAGLPLGIGVAGVLLGVAFWGLSVWESPSSLSTGQTCSQFDMCH